MCVDRIASNDGQRLIECENAASRTGLLQSHDAPAAGAFDFSIVSKDVLSLEGRDTGAAINETTRDRVTQLWKARCGALSRVRVLSDGASGRYTGWIRGQREKVVAAFEAAPAVVAAAGDQIDFLDSTLTYIGTEKPIGAAWAVVEREAPGIPQAKGENFGSHATARSHKRIAGRNTKLPPGAVVPEWVDAKDLAEEVGAVLTVPQIVVGAWTAVATCVTFIIIIGTAAIAGADVEQAVGTKLKLASVVVGLRLAELE